MMTSLVLPRNKQIGAQTSPNSNLLPVEPEHNSRSPCSQMYSHPVLHRTHSEMRVPVLQRVDANQPPVKANSKQDSSLQHTRDINIAEQYGKHVYLHHAKSVAKRFVHSAERETCLQIPDGIISTCVSYSFVYQDGLFQLAHYLEHALKNWKRPYVAKTILVAIIAHFLNDKKGTTTKPDANRLCEARKCYEALIESNYVVIVEVTAKSKMIAISATGSAPKYYKFIA